MRKQAVVNDYTFAKRKKIQMNSSKEKENGMMRGFNRGIIMFVTTILLSLGVPSIFQDVGINQVKAASFEQCGRSIKTGDYYIWSDGNAIRISESVSGEGEVLVNAGNGCSMGYTMISDGSVLYYYLNKSMTTASGYTSVGYIYQYDIKGKNSRRIGKVKNLEAIAAYHNHCLYLNCFREVGCVDTYRFNIKTKKRICIAKGLMVVEAKGKYLILEPYSSSSGALPIYSYDCVTKKKRIIAKKGFGIQIIGNKLYCSVSRVEDESNGNSIFRIYRCKLNGKGKKAISKDLECSFYSQTKQMYVGFKIAKKYVYFGKDNGSALKYYQYSIQTKKTKAITKSKFESIMRQ